MYLYIYWKEIRDITWIGSDYWCMIGGLKDGIETSEALDNGDTISMGQNLCAR